MRWRFFSEIAIYCLLFNCFGSNFRSLLLNCGDDFFQGSQFIVYCLTALVLTIGVYCLIAVSGFFRDRNSYLLDAVYFKIRARTRASLMCIFRHIRQQFFLQVRTKSLFKCMYTISIRETNHVNVNSNTICSCKLKEVWKKLRRECTCFKNVTTLNSLPC